VLAELSAFLTLQTTVDVVFDQAFGLILNRLYNNIINHKSGWMKKKADWIFIVKSTAPSSKSFMNELMGKLETSSHIFSETWNFCG
jgi:hypothetical protein